MPATTDPDTATTPAEEAAPSTAASLAARVAGLELDAETLEMVMAALTADFCDQVEAGTP